LLRLLFLDGSLELLPKVFALGDFLALVAEGLLMVICGSDHGVCRIVALAQFVSGTMAQ
jgi:hypothetical protein